MNEVQKLRPIMFVGTGSDVGKSVVNAAFCRIFRQDGYEIHMGESVAESASPLCEFDDGTKDGYFKEAKTWGTYIHGVFDNPSVVKAMLAEVSDGEVVEFDLEVYKNEQYDKLAELVRQHSDMKTIYASLKR